MASTCGTVSACWVPHQIAGRQDILVAMDWTDFDHDDQATLVLGLVGSQPAVCGSAAVADRVEGRTSRDQRNDYEDACLRRLSELSCHLGAVSPFWRTAASAIKKLFAFLGELGFDYVIRFRGNIHVSDTNGQTRLAKARLGEQETDAPASCAMPASAAKGQQVGAVVYARACQRQ